MKFNLSNIRKAVAVFKAAKPVVERAVVTATAVNSATEYKYKGKVNQALVGASAVVTGVAAVVGTVETLLGVFKK